MSRSLILQIYLDSLRIRINHYFTKRAQAFYSAHAQSEEVHVVVTHWRTGPLVVPSPLITSNGRRKNGPVHKTDQHWKPLKGYLHITGFLNSEPIKVLQTILIGKFTRSTCGRHCPITDNPALLARWQEPKNYSTI